MLQVFYELTPNAFAEMQTVRYQGLQVGVSCNQGNPNTGKVPFDDPGGTLDIKGWRKIRVVETTATPTLLWSGRIHNKTVRRGDSDRNSLRVGADRWWDCDAADQNTLIPSRVIRGTSGNRPAESAGERLAWLLGTSFTVLHDEGHVTYPADRLDAADYTSQTAANVLEDCALPGGYVYFAIQVDTLDATDTPELFFMKPESTDWASSVSLSDNLADVDNSTVFAPMYDAALDIIDEQVASGVFEPYAGGDTNAYVYVSDSDIGDEFAFVDRTVAQANVKTAAKATVIAERHLAASSTEAERITCSVLVPANMANAIRPWHRIAYKSTWMPNFAEYRDCRVTDWSITQHPWPGAGGGDGYRIDLELSPLGTTVVVACSTSLSGSEDHVTVGNGTTASDTITPSADGTILAFLIGLNSNTPAATNMAAISGYTAIYNINAAHKATYRIASKTASSGVGSTATATFTGGFAGVDVSIATQVAFPATLTLVQSKGTAGAGTSQGLTFDSTPTVGNMVVMFCHAEGTNLLAITPDKPDASWSEVGASTAALYPGQPDSEWYRTAVYSRCVEVGDGSPEYGFVGELTNNSIWIGEFSIA